MEQVLTWATPTLSIIGITALAIAGGLGIYGTFIKQTKQVETEASLAQSRLIDALKDQVDVLEKKVQENQRVIVEVSTKLELLVNENKALREILQGKDETTQAYQREAAKTFKVADKVLEIVAGTDQKIEKLLFNSMAK